MNEKIVVILGDGMADYSDENGQTPLTLAKKPTVDALAKLSEVGLCQTVPLGMKPGSDTANLSVIGYDPRVCYTGRSPLEAVSIGINMEQSDVAYRANLVTLSEGGDPVMLDYSAGEITSAEAKILIEYLREHLDSDDLKLYPGVSYRHCLIKKNAQLGALLTPPHDISGQKAASFFPKGRYEKELTALIEKSRELLKNHPVNLQRMERGLNPASSLWFWGEGVKPNLFDFEARYHLKGAVISAVDLLKGIAISAGMDSIDVEGATGTVHTNFDGKAAAAIKALQNHDYLYVHLEAPDECGHQGDKQGKIRSIELIDEKIIAPIKAYLDEKGGRYKLMFIPDHATPLVKRTHTSDPVPYLIYDSGKTVAGPDKYDEFSAKKTGISVDEGCKLIQKLLEF